MANQLQDAVLSAIDTLVSNRIDKIEADKTVTATIVQCTNSLTGEYKVSYNGGTMWAYAQEGATYSQNATVYVLVPQGDFTQKKTIVSKAQALEDDSNITFVSSALSNYNLIGKNPITDTFGQQPVQMCSYLKDNYVLLYKYGEEANSENKYLTIDGQELTNNIKDAEAVLIEASFKNRFPKEHKISKSGIFGLQFVLAFADRDNVDEEGNPATKYLSYTIDNNNMTGNPFLFLNWSDQYVIYPIDTENFLYIDSIMAFCNDFVEKDDISNASLWREDVFVKDVEFYGLKTITAINGDYKLNLSMPQGSTFKSILSTDLLQVVGKVTKLSDNLSDSTMFYWFAEDNRITSSSEEYQMYGGIGWRYLKDKGNNYTLSTYGSENRAYENKYLCVAVYKESVILKEHFTIYNEAARRNLSISSSLGVKFSFDRGTPTLTCLIDGKEDNFETGQVNYHPDSWFRFVWSKVDITGQTIIFNQTKEQLQAAYDQGIKDGIGYSELSSLRNQILAMEGVVFELGKNKLAYPVKQIDSSANFKCSVYLKDTADGEEYNIGTAEITLQNEGAANPNDYYIVIENGDQVFQYSESGVAPDDDRYTDPLEIKNLSCHFFDPAGLEVNNKTYEIKWLVPLESTLIVTPREGMTLNAATGKEEWCVSQDYPMAIADNYDYQALNNQIKAIVTYQGEEYTEETTFLFTKIGENGTNGTDIVGKVYPISNSSILDNELLTLELSNGVAEQWNTGDSPVAEVLGFNLYQRNEVLDIQKENITWTISGGSSSNSKYLSVSSNAGIITWDNTNAISRKFRNQIVRASTRLDGNDYYAFYPVSVVDYHINNQGQSKRYHVSLDSKKTLKNITYNADGRNPLYNKNQGIFISLGELNTNDLTNKYIVWYAEGGKPSQPTYSTYSDNPANAAFTLTYEKNSKEGLSILTPRDNPDGTWELLNELYILPNDIYDGAYCNNLVHGMIYSSKTVFENGGNPEVDIYIPIYMSLNTYGLKSLNAWDGNHVEINEDENYILAPQIGAGEKDDDNKFTGIVMGTTQTYDVDKPTIGLLGYSHGKQSILLDAEDGSATFGLPEDQASQNNEFQEGRIELNPGGESKIGMWTIGSRAIYNITSASLGQSSSDNNYSKIEPDKPYSDYPVDGSQISIPPTAQGMILNANPAYLSVKGMPLTENNSDIEWEGANTTIRQGDSLEVELDPRKSSVFSIYRHTEYDGETPTGSFRRYPLVGINANGQFYTNAIEDGESSMGIGVIGAFKHPAADQKYAGAQFAWRGTNLFKFFVDVDDTRQDENKKIYISTGSTVDHKVGQTTVKGDEYPREIGIYGDGVSLLAPETGKTNEETSVHTISITPTLATFGHTDGSYFTIPYNGSEDANLILKNNLNIKTAENRTTNILTGGLNIQTNGNSNSPNDISIYSAQDITSGAGRDFNLEITRYLHIQAKDFRMNAYVNPNEVTESIWKENMDTPKNGNTTNVTYSNVTEFDIGNDKSYIKLRPTSLKSRLHSETGWNMTSNTGGILINSQHASDGIVLQATSPNGSVSNGVRVSLIPQDGGGGDFLLTSPHGTIQSKSNVGTGSGRAGIQLYPGIATQWGFFTGKISGSDNSIAASYDISSTKNIRAGDDMYADDFNFNSNKSGSYNGTTYTYKSIWSHIERLYTLLRTTRTYANDRANEVQTWVKNQNYATQSWSNNRFARTNHNHDGRYAGSSHWHEISSQQTGYGRYTAVGIGGHYTDIDNSYQAGGVVTWVSGRTSGPQ